jgi:hypothetical protein
VSHQAGGSINIGHISAINLTLGFAKLITIADRFLSIVLVDNLFQDDYQMQENTL